MVEGFASVEIKYLVKYEFKEDKYKLTLTGFTLTDKNGTMPLENAGVVKNRWIKIINKKLPEIVSNLQNPATKTNW